jgi:hypothetical protein
MRQIESGARNRGTHASSVDHGRARAAARWRLVIYTAAVLPLLVIVVLARIYPNLNRPEIPDWTPIIARAQESWRKGDLYHARHFYVQAGRIASWREDWIGLIAAACGINRLDGVDGPYSKPFSILIRASIAAEARQSRRGIATVAKAFAALGAEKAASAVLARIQPSWPAERAEPDDIRVAEACSAGVTRPHYSWTRE